MIAIQIVGKGQLDLQVNTAITFEFISPLFKDSIAQTGYSYPIEIPMTDNNRKLLGFLDLLDIDQDFSPYNCIISYSGIQLVEGTLNINSIDSTKASCFILSYEFDVEKLDTNIRDIHLGGVRSIVPTLHPSMREHANESLLHSSDEWDYVFFPLKNPILYDQKTDTGFMAPHTFTGIANLWDFKNQSFWENPSFSRLTKDACYNAGQSLIFSQYQKIGYDYPPCASTFIPFPYVIYLLRQISSFLSYKLTGTWVSKQWVKNLVIYNNYTLDKEEEIANVTIPNTSCFPSLGITYDFFFNTCNSDINLSNHIPNISIGDFLNALANMFNLAISIKDKEIKIEERVGKLDSTDECQYIYENNIHISQAAPNGLKLSLTIDDDDAAAVPLKKLIIGNKVKEDAGAFLTSDAINDIRFSPIIYNGIMKVSTFSTKSGTAIPSAPTLLIGTGEKQIEANISAVQTTNNAIIHYSEEVSGVSSDIDYSSGIIPTVLQIGNSQMYDTEGEFTFRIMSYAGMHMDPNGFGDYPIGTDNIYDDNANAILPYSLKWRGGDFALYDAWYKNWQPIFSGKKVEVNLLLTIPEFINFDITKKLRIGNRLYFIEKLQIGISHNGLSKAKATCVQIPL